MCRQIFRTLRVLALLCRPSGGQASQVWRCSGGQPERPDARRLREVCTRRCPRGGAEAADRRSTAGDCRRACGAARAAQRRPVDTALVNGLETASGALARLLRVNKQLSGGLDEGLDAAVAKVLTEIGQGGV